MNFELNLPFANFKHLQKYLQYLFVHIWNAYDLCIDYVCWCMCVIYLSVCETCFDFVLPTYFKCIIEWYQFCAVQKPIMSDYLLSAKLTTHEYDLVLPSARKIKPAKVTAFIVYELESKQSIEWWNADNPNASPVHSSIPPAALLGR